MITGLRHALVAGGWWASCAFGAPPPHLELDVDLDPGTRQLYVRAQMVGERIGAFRLPSEMQVHSATADGAPVTVTSNAHGNSARWTLARPAERVLQITYSGALAPLDRALDHRDVLRTARAMASPDGTYLPASSGWYPAPQRLFTYRVQLTMAGGQRGLVAGRLIRETLHAQGGRYEAAFAFDQPTDGIDLMAGPYVVAERLVDRADGTRLRLRTYFTPATAGLAESYLTDTTRYLERYERRIGRYPFDGFSVVASPLPTGFGMPTLTYLGERILPLPFVRAASLGHEVLHNWWGNGVYVDYATGNWAEGLTTFLADYAYKEENGEDAALEMRLGWLRDFAAVPGASLMPLAQFRTRAHGAAAATGYGKSAMVFLMLRDLIGDDAFDEGLRSFWKTHQFRVAGWSDLKNAFEGSAARSLDKFFDQWVQRPGGPAISIERARLVRAGAGARVEVTLRQTSPAYALRLPIEFATANRKATAWVEAGRDPQTVELDLPFVPDTAVLDPGLRVWRVLEPSSLPPILRQWILAEAPVVLTVSQDAGVVHAARVLTDALFEVRASHVDRANALPAVPGAGPVLIVGLHADVDRALQTLGLPARPGQIAGHGTAQVWTVPGRPDARPVAVVSAQDAGSIAALTRPLPHYGAQSFLAFDGRRALRRGVWPVGSRRVNVER